MDSSNLFVEILLIVKSFPRFELLRVAWHVLSVSSSSSSSFFFRGRKEITITLLGREVYLLVKGKYLRRRRGREGKEKSVRIVGRDAGGRVERNIELVKS